MSKLVGKMIDEIIEGLEAEANALFKLECETKAKRKDIYAQLDELKEAKDILEREG